MTKEEARRCLSDWIDYATNPEAHPFIDAPCSDDEIIEAMRIGSEALSEPSLPSNLDEAAKDYQERIYDGEYSGHIKRYQDTFKAGAEWMAGQFQKIEGDLVDWYSTSDGKDYCCGVKTQDAFEVPEEFYIRKK